MALKLEMYHSRPPADAECVRPRPILFVHGSFCGAWIWAERWMPHFAAKGFICHAVSLRGHGESEGDIDSATFSDYVRDIENTLKSFDEPVILIGHSMGGLVVQHIVARHPEKIAAAVALASVPPSGLASSMAHLTMFAPDVLLQLGSLQSFGAAALSASIICRAFFSGERNAQAAAHLLPRLQNESQQASLELMAPPWPPVIPGFGTSVPMLVMGGDADTLLPVSAYHEIAFTFSADLRVLNGAPHGLMLDDAWWQPAADELIGWLTAKGF